MKATSTAPGAPRSTRPDAPPPGRVERGAPTTSFLDQMTRPVLTLAPAGPLDALSLLARIEADTAALRAVLQPRGRGRPKTGRTPVEIEGDVALILAAVELDYGVPRAELFGPSRLAGVVWPRQLAIWLLRSLTHLTLRDISGLFRQNGGTDYAVKKVAAVLATEMDRRARVRALLERLTPTLQHARPVALPPTGGRGATRALTGGDNGAGVEPSPPQAKAAHRCACGRPAALKKNSSWVCARCDAIEKR